MPATLTRSVFAIPLAAIVTFSLFWVMQYLVAIGSGKLDDAVQGAAIEFVRVKKDESLNEKARRKPPRPTKPDTPPPPPPMQQSKAKPSADNMGIGIPNLGDGVDMAGGVNLGAGSDGDIMPLVRVAPQYPRRALSRGIEGWVQVEFTISKVGTVENPSVIDADPPGIFNRAAMKAVAKWKYKPKIEDGVAVERHGVSTVITFELDK
ncbi:MAG: energy transducer TonB [Alphaproteobacteria bacterium]